ncbi:MAG: cell division protein ZapE, partial [Halomonas sp.]|nr:cell division protein ZapE [Halomonas sp.]
MSSISAGGAAIKTRPASPIERYRADLERADFQYDAAQELAVKHLQRLYDELVAAPTTVPKALVANKGLHKGLKAKMAGFMSKKSSSPGGPALPQV